MATWYTHGNKCDKRWKTHRAEHCPACHETFSGTKTGDAHRVGEHGVTEGPDRRRCLPVSEVLIKRGKRGAFGLKWNEDRQYWQEDDPDSRFRDVATPLDSSTRGLTGGELLLQSWTPEKAALLQRMVAEGRINTRRITKEEQ